MATRDPKEVVDSVYTVDLLWHVLKFVCAKGLNTSFKMLQGGEASKRSLVGAFKERIVGPPPSSWPFAFQLSEFALP